MIDPVDPDSSTGDGPRRHFWGLNLRRRGDIQQVQGARRRRVVSEPLPGMRRMAVLRKFKFGRQEQDFEEEEEGDLTISTETDVSLADEDSGTKPPRSRTTSRSTDSGPSFISFAPTSPSTDNASPLRPRRRERPPNPTPSSDSPQLAPILDPPLITPTRGEAIRAITTEARFAGISTSTNDSREWEYPSIADTSSSIGGILRARHSRVPNNTPVQNVRFLDSPRTEYLRRKARERLQVTVDDDIKTPEPLPRAQITQTSRWTRLGEILHIIENEDLPESESVSSTPERVSEPVTPVNTRTKYRSHSYSAASSPISFARFDPPEPICSTPIPRYRFPAGSQSPYQPPRRLPMPSPLSDPSQSHSMELSSTWSTRYADEDGIVEVCSALEALWEYGSSTGDGSHIKEEGDMPSDDSEEKGTEYSGERRGSADLLPLKFKGYPKDLDEEPFPFASSLRF